MSVEVLTRLSRQDRPLPLYSSLSIALLSSKMCRNARVSGFTCIASLCNRHVCRIINGVLQRNGNSMGGRSFFSITGKSKGCPVAVGEAAIKESQLVQQDILGVFGKANVRRAYPAANPRQQQ